MAEDISVGPEEASAMGEQSLQARAQHPGYCSRLAGFLGL